MSRYTGYNQRGFANSTVAITRATSGSSTPIDITGDGSSTKVYLPLNDNTNDASGNFTISGTASVSSTEAKFGGGSALFNTGTTHLTASGSQSAMAFTGAFTIEMWVYQTATPSGGGYTIAAVHNSSGWLWQLKPTYSRFWVNSSTYARFEETLTNNTWHHLAVVREAAGGVVKFYLNGTLKATSGSTPSTMVSNRDLYIGAYKSGSSSQNFQGYIDDFRILDGVALYTSNFTPPTSALGIHRIDPVSLYLPFDSDVNDDSTFGHSVTASGSAAISSTQSKFGGNSLFIDADGDYLTIPSDSGFKFEQEDFTIEMFIRPDDVSTTDQTSNVATILDHDQGASTAGAWFALHQNNQALVFSSNNGSNSFTSSNCLSAATWHHIAVVRLGDVMTIYCDGVAVGSASHSYNFSDSTTRELYIGKQVVGSGTRRFDGYIDDLRITKGVARYTKNFVPPSQAVGATLNGTNETNTTTDFTALYLPFDSDVQDDSPQSHTVTAYGNAAISSTQAKFGGNSLSLDGAGDYLRIADHPSIGSDLRQTDLTIEAWLYQNDDTGHMIVCRRSDGGHWETGAWLFGVNTNIASSNDDAGRVQFWAYGYNQSSSLLEFDNGSAFSSGWHHFAVTRSNDVWMLFVDGIKVDTQEWTGGFGDRELPLYIGKDTYSGARYETNGYIDDFRILKGYAAYTADFVPPTTAVGTSVSETVNDLAVLYMPFDGTNTTSSVPSSQTSLYLPFDSDTNDDSSQSHTVTNNGVTISSAQSKFGGYSALFDGTNDYLSIPSNSSLVFGDEDFTVEFFIYTNDDTLQSPFTHRDGSAGAGDWTIPLNRTVAGQIEWYNGDYSVSVAVVSTTISGGFSGGWHHIAITRSGDTHRIFFDGELKASATNSTTYSSGPSELHIGRDNYAGGRYYLDGYLDDIRIIKGTALYTESFTVPTSALGATGTAISFAGGFEDLARNNVVTKEGDTTLSTSVKKFGTSSAYFDGTGDRVLVSHGGELNLSDGDFTIEGWFYFTSNATARIFHGEEGTHTYSPWLLYTTSGGAIQFYASSNNSSWDVVSTASLGTVTLNTWTHLAVTREGNTFRCFQDGVLKSTSTSSSSLYYNTDNQIAIGGRSGTNYMPGYAEDLRIIKGKAIYTAAFTPPTSAHGHDSLAITSSTSETYSDTKFLSGVWDITDVRDKMMQSTWVSNDSRLPNGAGLQVDGHRWYAGPSGPSPAPITITAYGAGGGDSDAYGREGGAGGYAQLTIDNFPTEDTLYVVVGQAGNRPGPSVAPGGRTFGGGGGSRATSGGHPHQAPGGGLSGVFTAPWSNGPGTSGPGLPQASVVIVAGGGGGAGGQSSGGNSSHGKGGDGGGPTGQAGTFGNGNTSAGGGTQSGGGSASPYGGAGIGGQAPIPGGFLFGGNAHLGEAGGGGGGGYYGGGGGGYRPSPTGHTGSGGGGSGYVGGGPYTATNTTNTQGGGSAAETNGQVTIRNNDTEVTTTFNYTGSEQTFTL